MSSDFSRQEFIQPEFLKRDIPLGYHKSTVSRPGYFLLRARREACQNVASGILPATEIWQAYQFTILALVSWPTELAWHIPTFLWGTNRSAIKIELLSEGSVDF